ncbi:MAG: hypothetical protein IJP62_03330 [Treponema sp.]|nr:hypothetical protein [Treponema sp.]
MNELATSTTALTPEQAFPFQKEIDTWNMENAVAGLRPKVEQLKKASVEVCRSLFIAHEALAQRGGDRRSEDAQTFGFTDFLELVGISKKTAYVWLRLYDPATDSFVTPEETDVRKLKGTAPEVLQASPTQQGLLSKKEQLIAHAMTTGERLYEEGWNELGCEKEYKLRKSNEKLAEMARRWGKPVARTSWSSGDYFSQTVIAKSKSFARFNLQTKEQYRAQLEVFDMLNEYLQSFDDPAVRMAAVCNIGLRIRSIVNEMHDAERKLGIEVSV